MNERFVDSFSYKLIYIFRINDEAHKGLLKIGDATLKTTESIDKLSPNCRLLNQAAKKRIDEYTSTAGIAYDLLHTELAVRTDMKKGVIVGFRDHDVHAVLEHSKIKKIIIKDTKAREWFKIDLDTAKKAIEAVKQFRPALNPSEQNIEFTPIVFRPEQLEAIKATIKEFKTGNRMLWNAKMRFGKTLSALEVIRQMQFSKTIIVTHRPVVDSGWYEDFSKIFHHEQDFIYGSKNNGYTVEKLLESGKKFIYFASIQDLRGSEKVGGKFEKNSAVFGTKWDCVIVDEAHEGTTTALGEEVINAIVTENTKFLALSGTPFNILGNYDNNVYTWDYIMEQRCKAEWDNEHFGDSNPYDELPKMNIFVYDLGKLLGNKYVELEDRAFNFHEFFRTWTGFIQRDFKPVPPNAKVGDFVHADDVLSFLNLITKEDTDSQYPYSTENYRHLFRHALWMLPGVREAKALSKMMKKHPVFSMFRIVNVAGDGDEEERTDTALQKVYDAIKEAGEDGYTITLSCGKLTTGVTVKEWNAVFMLAGSFSTSAANYLQTIFRVQSPCNQNGKFKDSCYVFDFAPDRTLKMVAESVALSTKAGKATESDRKIMGEFLNYCPVIAIEGTMMKEYSTNRLLQQLKKAYAERAVQNGFDDTNLYNDELLKLSDVDLAEFDKLKKIIGASKAQQKTKDIDINSQGFTNEEYEELGRLEKKPKKERSPEEQARLDELKEQKKNRGTAISILRGISIRMPLLIYGADIAIDEEFTLDKFLDDTIIDEASWTEFMPSGVTRQVFKQFMKYYDQDIFVAAGRRIRNTVKGADELSPTERVKQIAQLFACFKNPDKETVLTPWRVVNMHMSDCLGGYSFYPENPSVNAPMLDEPRFVDRGEATADTFGNINSHILEINSKTGLYPLYVVYSIFRTRCNAFTEDELTLEKQNALWAETVRENIFVICKTPMAKFITRRTLVGYRDIPVNAHYFDDLINTMQNKQKQFVERVLKPSYWKRKGDVMKFDAVVGNPPYQEETIQKISETNGQAPRKSIFQHFQITADIVTSRMTALIYPGARWIHRSGKGMEQFGYEQINDITLKRLDFYPDSRDIFTNVAIGDGISIVCKDKTKKEKGFTYVYHKNGTATIMHLNNPGKDLMPLNPKDISIVNKVTKVVEKYNLLYLHDRILPRNLFGIESNFVENNPELVKPYHDNTILEATSEIKLFTNDKAGKAGRAKWFVADKSVIAPSQQQYISQWQVVVSSANAGGQKRDNQIEIIDNHSAFGRSRVALGTFDTKEEAINFYHYVKTYLIRFLFLMTDEALTSLGKKVPDFVDYNNKCHIINFAEDIDNQLYSIFELEPSEIEYIEQTINQQRKKN